MRGERGELNVVMLVTDDQYHVVKNLDPRHSRMVTVRTDPAALRTALCVGLDVLTGQVDQQWPDSLGHPGAEVRVRNTTPLERPFVEQGELELIVESVRPEAGP